MLASYGQHGSRALVLKPGVTDAHRMYAKDQVIIHMARM
jgi:hypothetical protein